MLSRFLSLFPTAARDPELHPVRHGLLFAFFNALTWQVGIGTPVILFAEKLGANSFQVGLVYSFVFLLTPLQVLSTALLPRYGFKKIMMSGWTLRSVFLSVPLILALFAPEQGNPWMVRLLVWSVFFFCVFRAIGAAAIIPWLYALLPPGARGRYFSNDQFLSGLAGVGTLVVCSATFALLPIYTAFIVQYLLALGGSFAANYALQRLPDVPHPTALSLRKVLVGTLRSPHEG